ncbi:MAG: type II secretion system protein [bacterium]|nr:type II secretion system protein [bacterium]
MKLKSGLKGFTFIEMLVVLVLIATLMSIIMVRLNRASSTSRDKKRSVDLHMIQAALGLYYSDWDDYPDSLSFSQVFEDSNNRVYMQEMPNDPSYPKQTYYYAKSATAGFVLCAAMEESKNIPASGSIYYPPSSVPAGGCTVDCNYCLKPF